MITRTGDPRVHGAWTHDWWSGEPTWTSLFGQAPSVPALEGAATRVSAAWPSGSWSHALHPVSQRRPAPHPDALVVLAGQQPVLAGGPALVVHKAATAIRLARQAADALQRPVVPVFLLATQDHDSDEVGHIDTFDTAKASYRRYRCRIHPGDDMFSRSEWDKSGMEQLTRHKSAFCDVPERYITPGLNVADHPARMIDAVLGDAGLLLVEAHAFEPQGRPIIQRALADPANLAGHLRHGAEQLRARGVTAAFDPDDPRPLVLESRGGRRQRIEADDSEAIARFTAHPEDFSPHAALRPIVQARGLPVIAQVVGPSEMMYLGQARGLHGAFGLPEPVLVPRMEATHMSPELFASLGEDALADQPTPVGEAEAALQQAVARFAEELGAQEADLVPRLERLRNSVTKRARSLVERSAWRAPAARGLRAMTRPRGRWQDSVLAWAPHAWAAGDPTGYGRHLIAMCEPLEPPVHVIHTYPEDGDG